MPATTRKNTKRPASDPKPGPPATKRVKQDAPKATSRNTSKNIERPKRTSKQKEKAKEAKKDERGKSKPKTDSQSNGTSRNTRAATNKTVDAPKRWQMNESDYELSGSDYFLHVLNFSLLVATLF
ncbi:uncharacterized protein N7484_002321 [Penicillium longicatenatum]|uniref:uncharacterized protein n=1 Tax=Penicillium longicatenatum TaxID=1561947 RepID=UPI002546B7FE|nr:uncharacterized protein N7484_002321 [Penicillium longicatenatum]KAJ5658672.1 hypothetical protein N7484_002321 [Penicillium longicatenatum]